MPLACAWRRVALTFESDIARGRPPLDLEHYAIHSLKSRAGVAV